MTQDHFHIWNGHHKEWWGNEGRRGTADVLFAGIYTREETEKYLRYNDGTQVTMAVDPDVDLFLCFVAREKRAR